VHESRLLIGIAALFAGMTVLLAVLGIVYNPLILVVAALFGGVTYALWTHGTGRLAARLYRGVERRGAGSAATHERRRRARGQARATVAEARETLGLGPEADESEVRRAYREKVKDVHPDTEGGDEERFKEVTRAYERLMDE